MSSGVGVSGDDGRAIRPDQFGPDAVPVIGAKIPAADESARPLLKDHAAFGGGAPTSVLVAPLPELVGVEPVQHGKGGDRLSARAAEVFVERHAPHYRSGSYVAQGEGPRVYPAIARATLGRMKREPAREEWLHRRLKEAVDQFAGGSADAFGRMLGYTNGGPVRQSLSKARPVQQAILERSRHIPGMESWFDMTNPASEGGVRKALPGTINSNLAADSSRFTLLPVVELSSTAMEQKNDMVRAGWLDWVSVPGKYSSFAKYTQMPDDSMAPEILQGEYVCFDPEVRPDAGDVVLISDQYGGLWVRRYRLLPGGKFDAVAANAEHAPLRSTEDGLRVLAVMVAHIRGRRAKRH